MSGSAAAGGGAREGADAKTALRIREELRRRIEAHGEETYPFECCGALLGRDGGAEGDGDGLREVLDLVPLANRRDDSPRNRFEVTPEDVRLVEKIAREKKIELIGWYHSHPDCEARPSEYDRDHAWPWYSYIIVSVRERVAREMRSWRLQDDRAAYDAEAIEVSAGSAAGSARVATETQRHGEHR